MGTLCALFNFIFVLMWIQLFSSCSERGFRAIKILYVVCGAREREGEGWGGEKGEGRLCVESEK